MSKEHNGSSWQINEEDARRLFTLTPDDLYFLRTIRVDFPTTLSCAGVAVGTR